MWTKKAHLTGQKKPFKLEDIWRIRTRLEIEGNAKVNEYHKIDS